MFIKKSLYKKRISLNKEEAVQKLLHSTEFKVESEYGYGGFLYHSSQSGSSYLGQIDDYSFQFSESNGFGGTFETVGKLDILDSQNGSIVQLKFTMGIFPIKLPQLVTPILIIAGFIVLNFNQLFAIILFGASFMSLVLWLVKFLSIKLLLKRFSKTLEVNNIWDD